MEKEIVIASFEEDTSWIPEDLYKYILLYSSGNPKKKIQDRFRFDQLERFDSVKALNMGPHNMGPHGRSDAIETLKDLTEILSNLKKLFFDGITDEESDNTFTNKKIENDINSLESNQWLTHIIQRYDVLADVTLFTQGHPHDHMSDWERYYYHDFSKDFSFCTLPNTGSQEIGVSADHHHINGLSFLKENIGLQEKDLKEMNWAGGAAFAASKEVLRSKPKEYYVALQLAGSNTPFSAHYFERYWWNMLGCPEVTNFV